MLIPRHTSLLADDLFIIERVMLRYTDPDMNVPQLLDYVVFDKSRPEIYGLILGLMHRLNVFDCLGVTTSEFLDFLIDVDTHYNHIAYHSFHHAVDVTIVLLQMLFHYDVARDLTPVDVGCLLIAALCHDCGHPGKNNNFQVNIKSDLSIRYHNRSVLESYSCTIAMNLLTRHRLLRNIHRNSAALGCETTETEARVAIIKMILATDMIFHYEQQENITRLMNVIGDEQDPDVTVKDLFDDLGSQNPLQYFESQLVEGCEEDEAHGPPSPLPTTDAGHDDAVPPQTEAAVQWHMTQLERLVLCQALLHAADISNPLRPWPICEAWSVRVCDEFFSQGDAERKLHLQVSPNMDRHKSTYTSISLQFGDFVVSPFFEIFAALFPKVEELLTLLAANRAEWIKLDGKEMESNEDRGCLPHQILPDRRILNPSGRRVSVAAGMVVIPDELEERTIGSGPNQRTYWGVRSHSHSDIRRREQSLVEPGRRKSEDGRARAIGRLALSSAPVPEFASKAAMITSSPLATHHDICMPPHPYVDDN